MRTNSTHRFPKRAIAAVTAALFVPLLVITLFGTFSSPNTAVSEAQFRAQKDGGHRAAVERKVARDSYFNMIYKDPALGRIPDGIRERELAYARTLPTDSDFLAKRGALTFDWKEAGPTDVGGRTRALIIDVTDSNTLITGGVSGGIWKSTDAGASWRLVSENHLAITDIAQDTRAGFTDTWYASTGESKDTFNTNVETTGNLFGTGLYKSTDAGESWSQIQSAGNPTVWDTSYDFVVRLIVSPTTGTVFYVENSDGLFRSSDGGASFSLAHGTAFEHAWGDVAVDANGNLLLVLAGNAASASTVGVFRSTDDGVTWTPIHENNGATFPSPFDGEYSRPVIALAPSNPDVAYILTYMGVKKTVTGGEIEDVRFHKLTISTGTYEDRSANIPVFLKDEGEFFLGVLNTQDSYNMTIAVHPADENHVIIGGTNLFRSRDGFATAPTDKNDTWIGGYSIDDNNSDYANNHPDHHVLRFETSVPFRLYNGHDGGLSVSDDVVPNGPIVWRNLNNVYNVTQFYTVSIARAAGDDRILGGTQDNGSPFFRWDGASATPSSDASGGDGAFAYMGADIIYSSSQNGFLLFQVISPSGTPSFQFAQADSPCSDCGALFINPGAVNPNNENIVFFPAGADLYRSDDAGNWTQLTNLTLPAGYGMGALSMSTTPADILYYAGYSASDTPMIFRLEDANTSMQPALDRSPAHAEDGAYILSIGVNPADPDEILVALSNYGVVSIAHSTDGGQTYANAEGNLAGTNDDGPSVRAASILPFNGEKTYFVATSVGVFSTAEINGASTVWTQVAASIMGNTATAWLDSRPSDGRVAIATHGRGIFVGTPTVSGVASEAEGEIPAKFVLHGAYPNPFNPTTTLQFDLPESADVRVRVSDMLGRSVLTVPVQSIAAGTARNIRIDASGLSSGTYIYRVIADMQSRTSVQTGTFVLIK